MKNLKKSLLAWFVALAFIATANAQSTTETQSVATKKLVSKYDRSYPYLSIAPMGGAIFPMGQLSSNYKPNANVGLDFSVRINKEVAISGDVNYNFMSSQVNGVESASYLQYTVGPRYYFTHPSVKSSLFFEGGVGGYSFFNNNDVEDRAYDGTNVGMNTGLGATLFLSDDIDIIVKSKYHFIFNKTGSSSFITTTAGLEFRF